MTNQLTKKEEKGCGIAPYTALPCPFCGCGNIIGEGAPDSDSLYCSDCGIGITSSVSSQVCIDAWNRRTITAESICALIPNYPEAQKEIRAIKGEIKKYYFDLAYGGTPALFIDIGRDGDVFLERIRLERPQSESAAGESDRFLSLQKEFVAEKQNHEKQMNEQRKKFAELSAATDALLTGLRAVMSIANSAIVDAEQVSKDEN